MAKQKFHMRRESDWSKRKRDKANAEWRKRQRRNKELRYG